MCPSWWKFARSQSSAFIDEKVALSRSRGEVGIILQWWHTRTRTHTQVSIIKQHLQWWQGGLRHKTRRPPRPPQSRAEVTPSSLVLSHQTVCCSARVQPVSLGHGPACLQTFTTLPQLTVADFQDNKTTTTTSVRGIITRRNIFHNSHYESCLMWRCHSDSYGFGPNEKCSFNHKVLSAASFAALTPKIFSMPEGSEVIILKSLYSGIFV